MFDKYHEPGRWRRRIAILRELAERGFDYRFWAYRAKWNLAGARKIVFSFPIHLDIEHNCGDSLIMFSFLLINKCPLKSVPLSCWLKRQAYFN